VDSINIDPRKLIAESLGAFTLIFVGAGSIIVSAGTTQANNLLPIALAHGLAIGLMFVALSQISGAHFNPAVTIGFWVTRRIETILGVAYIIAQLAGAIIAALLLAALLPEAQQEIVSLGTPALGPDTTALQGVVIEAILTFLLVTLIFGSAVAAVPPKLAGLGIGLAITMDWLMAGPLTGAALNPARAFGPALVDQTWGDHLVWWIGPIIGAVVGALVYHYLFLEEES
jgi:MIP family channel proteins